MGCFGCKFGGEVVWVLLDLPPLLAMAPARIRPGDTGVSRGMPSSGVLRNYREDLGFSPARHAFPLPLYEPFHVLSTFLEELPLPLLHMGLHGTVNQEAPPTPRSCMQHS